MSLLTSRRLGPLLVPQTLGALNDNLFKNALVVLILFRAGQAGAPVPFAVLFGLGIQATFSGPLKYSILPAHLAVDELVAGNGLVEAGTWCRSATRLFERCPEPA